jgi:hypothetical protein
MVVLVGVFLVGMLVAAGLVYVMHEDRGPVLKVPGKRTPALHERSVAKRDDLDGLYAVAMAP